MVNSFQFSGLAYLDLFRFCFLSFGQCHPQNSILIGSSDLTWIHTGRQRDAPSKCADVALSALSCFAVIALALTLTADRQRPVMQRNLDDILTHPGQFDDRDKMVATLVKVE